MRTCAFPNCFSGFQPTAGEKLISFFKPPKDSELFSKWVEAIGESYPPLSPRSFVCSLHFANEDLLTHFEAVLIGGEVHRVPRKKPTLKAGSIPVALPHSPARENCTIPPSVNEVSMLPPIQKTYSARPSYAVSEEVSPDPLVNSGIEMAEEQEPFPHGSLDQITNVPLPNEQWGKMAFEGKGIVFQEFTPDLKQVTRRIVLYKNLEVKVWIQQTPITVEGYDKIYSAETLSSFFSVVANIPLCETAKKAFLKFECRGFAQEIGKSCLPCVEYSRMAKNSEAQKKKRTLKKATCHRYRNLKTHRMRKKVTSLTARVAKLRRACAAKHKADIQRQIENLPISQKEAVNASLKTLTCKAKGVRYTRNWIFQCLLLKIKSSAGYSHIRRHNILSLPAPSTLHRYLRKLKPTYGFQPTVFNMMKKKSNCMKDWEKRGVLLVDEMKLSEKLTFSKENLKITGFVDIGKYTPQNQKCAQGDHALVIIFQPFVGRWFQAIGAFLTKACANSQVLHQLLLEAIVHVENSGFFVDGVVSDGAQWNRGMWKLFGINENNISATHILDVNRRLFLFSDFPHLAKNFRNWVVQQSKFNTPYGIVNFSLWEEIVKYDESKGPCGLKICPKLTSRHLNPKYYEKMNVAKAYQLFGFDVATAMRELKFEESEATIEFILLVNDVIQAMTSRHPLKALKINCREREVIEKFLHFLNEWREGWPHSKGFLPTNTFVGLIVTCRGVIELSEYLINNYGYSYLMVSRTSQDNLERFFGMVRSSGGNNDHPDPTMFIFIYRLLCVYSLIKPPKGSNVDSSELVTWLLDEDQYVQSVDNPFRDHWHAIKDAIRCSFQKENDRNEEADDDIHDESLLYLAGFVTKHFLKKRDCPECLLTLTSNKVSSSLISTRDKFGALNFPSRALVELLSFVEAAIKKEAEEFKLRQDFFLTVAEHLHEASENSCLPTIGCALHKEDLTLHVIEYYMIMRMNFITTSSNMNKNEKCREIRKKSRLV